MGLSVPLDFIEACAELSTIRSPEGKPVILIGSRVMDLTIDYENGPKGSVIEAIGRMLAIGAAQVAEQERAERKRLADERAARRAAQGSGYDPYDLRPESVQATT